MKMNKFRNNLHPAFFNDSAETRERFNDNVESQKEVLSNLKKEIEAKNEFQVNYVINGLGEEQKPKYADNLMGRKVDQERFVKRINEDNHKKTWEKNISNGIGHLITQLTETGYFNEIKDKEGEVNKIKDLYYEEVRNQFLDFVRYAGEKTYKKVKGNLFDYKTQNSPANKIYKKLTNADSLTYEDGGRMFVEAYSTKIENPTEQTNNPEPKGLETNNKTKENRKFLSKTLPVALWNLKTQFADSTFINKVPILNMIISIGNVSESQNDREAIADFVDIASKIKVPEGKIPEIELLKLFAEMNPSSGKTEYEQALRIHGIDLNGIKFNDFMEAGKYYVRTQTRELGKQHAIYLGILQVIKDNGSIDNAVSQLKPEIELANKWNKEHGKEYRKGKETALNQDTKAFAEKLGITDFTNISRLSNLPENYFTSTPVEDILANLNNDNMIAASDWQKGGMKSGQQFLEIYSKLDDAGKKKALTNLLERAKLESKIYGVDFGDVNDVERAIKDGNLQLIFLLQNIIANPGGDLHTLLTGEKGRSLDLKQLDVENYDRALEYAGQQLTEEEYNQIISKVKKEEGTEITSFAAVQASMASCLYDNYKLGVGVSTNISFDEWVKGVKLGGGVQVRGKDKGVIGINMTYDKKFLESKGWTLKGQLGAGVNVPIVSGKIKDPIGTANAAFSGDKKLTTKTGSAWHVGVDGGVSIDTTGQPVLYGGLHAFLDKTESLGEAADKNKTIMEKELYNLLEKKSGNLNVMEMRSEIEEWVKKSGVKKEDVNNVTNGILKILISYDGVNIDDNATKLAIASKVADQYKLTRMENQKEKKSKHYYFGGAALGVFLTLGTPRWGVYADLRIAQRHYVDGNVDVSTRVQERRDVSQEFSDSGDAGERTEDRIKTLNQRLSIEKGGLEFDKDKKLVKIPESLVRTGMIKVGDDMVGKMYKEGNDVYLSQWSPIHEEIDEGTGTFGRALHIGNGKNEIVLNNRVASSWYAESKEALNSVMIKEMNAKLYTVENARKAIEMAIKDKDILSDFNLEASDIVDKIEALGKNSFLKKANDKNKTINCDKKVKITIERNKNGFDIRAEETEEQGSGFEVDYQVKLEMFNSEAENIAKQVYTQVSKLENAEILNSVKHEKGKYYSEFKDDYNAFIEAMGLYDNVGTKNYETAKKRIQAIFTTLDDLYSGKANFSAIGNKLNNLSGEDLGQALLSINNIFARSSRVKGSAGNTENREYTFTTNIGNIIADREDQISRTIQRVLGDKDPGYLKLIQAMGTHRKANFESFNTRSASAYTNLNTVGFNLGDSTNPENPLFNPEIYDIDVPLDELEGIGKDEINNLHKHAMELFAKNNTLFHNIKKAFGLSDDDNVDIKKFESGDVLGKKGKLTLDIGGKKVTLSADMKVGYFTQCVNHTIILENIQAESEGLQVNYNSVTGGADKVSETSGGTRLGTWNLNLHLAGTFGKKRGNDNTPVGSDRADDGGKQYHSDDGKKPDLDNNPPEVNNDPTKTDTGGEEV